MNQPILTLLVSIALTCASFAQALDMKTISPGELVQAIKEKAGAINGGEIKSSYIDAAIESKRFDLIAACFCSYGTKTRTLNHVEKLPLGEFRTKALIALIRAPCDYWPADREEGMIFGVSMLNPIYNIQREPFLSLLAELMPQKAVSIKTVRYQGRRNKLADELLEAFQQKGGQITPEELEALKSIPQCINGAAEAGYEDPAYTKIDPNAPGFTMEAYMKVAYAAPEWKPPVVKLPKAKVEEAAPDPKQALPDEPEATSGSGVWLAGTLSALALLVWRWRRRGN